METVNYHLLKDTLQSVPDGSLSILYVCIELLYWFFHDVSLGGSFVILFLCVWLSMSHIWSLERYSRGCIEKLYKLSKTAEEPEWNISGLYRPNAKLYPELQCQNANIEDIYCIKHGVERRFHSMGSFRWPHEGVSVAKEPGLDTNYDPS